MFKNGTKLTIEWYLENKIGYMNSQIVNIRNVIKRCIEIDNLAFKCNIRIKRNLQSNTICSLM